MGNPSEENDRTPKPIRIVAQTLRPLSRGFVLRLGKTLGWVRLTQASHRLSEWRRQSGQIRIAHEIAITLTGGAAAFVKGPNHQALATPTITGGKDAFDISRIFFEVGFDIGARVAFQAEGIKQGLFGAEKAHGKEYKLGGQSTFGTRNFYGHELAFIVAFPLDLNGQDFLDASLFTVKELFRGG